jgi:hypothetical protein
MRTILRVLALGLLVGAVGMWIATGANRGWTKTSVPKKIVDDVTGIEGQTYEKKFVPGVDFLAAAAGASVILAGASFFFRTKSPACTSNEQSSNQPK